MTARERSRPGYRQLHAQLEQAEALIQQLRDLKRDALGPRGSAALSRLSAVAAHLERANSALRQTVKGVGAKPRKRAARGGKALGAVGPGRAAAGVAQGRGSSGSTVRKKAAKEEERKIRLIVADDHRIFREVLTRVLNLCPDFEVVGEAEDGESAVALSSKLKPDVVLMDATLPGISGVEATRRILSESSASRIVGLSARDDGDSAMLMVQAGAAAYMTKGGQTSQLLDAIRFAAGRQTRAPSGVAPAGQAPPGAPSGQASSGQAPSGQTPSGGVSADAGSTTAK